MTKCTNISKNTEPENLNPAGPVLPTATWPTRELHPDVFQRESAILPLTRLPVFEISVVLSVFGVSVSAHTATVGVTMDCALNFICAAGVRLQEDHPSECRTGFVMQSTYSSNSTFSEGRYQIIRLLGSGGMGEVYLATDTNLDAKVVIKIPHVSMLKDDDAR